MQETQKPSESEVPTPSETDEHLILAFASGNSDAFAELFRRYKQPLFGFFRRRMPEEACAQAEELTQETFLAVIRSANRYVETALFRTYLYAIGFRVLNSYRKRTAFRATFMGSADLENETGRDDAVDAYLQVRQAMGRLQHMDREMLMLREYEELSYAEISELLKLPLNTVRSRLFRARVTLRAILAAPAKHSTNSTDREDRL
jgi:RNA polymerase sigma-70 factor (ECF subfamily)